MAISSVSIKIFKTITSSFHEDKNCTQDYFDRVELFPYMKLLLKSLEPFDGEQSLNMQIELCAYMGVTLDAMNHYREAIVYFEQGLQLIGLSQEHEVWAWRLTNFLSYAYLHVGELLKAEAILKPFESKVSGQNIESIMTLNRLGLVKLKQEKYTESYQYFNDGYQIALNLLGQDSLMVARCHCFIGQALAELGRFPEAKQNLDRAHEIKRKVYDALHPSHALTDKAYARYFKLLGEIDQYTGCLLRAKEVEKSVYGENHAHYLETELLLKNGV